MVGLMGVPPRGKEYAKQVAKDYAEGNLPPEAAPMVAAADVIINGGSAEEAANAAMQSTCVMATGGAGSVACKYATIDNLVEIQHFVHGMLPKSWQARGKMQCWFLDYKVVRAAEDIYGEMNLLVDKAYQDTRKAVGLPPKAILRELIGSDGQTRRPLVPAYHDIVINHPKWTSTEKGGYNYSKAACDYSKSGPITCSQKSIILPGGPNNPWHWKSTSSDDCEDFGIRSFNSNLMNLYAKSRLLAAKDCISPALATLSKDIDKDLFTSKLTFKKPTLSVAPRPQSSVQPAGGMSKGAKIAIGVAAVSIVAAYVIWNKRK